jgi:hypothetical protein
VSPSEASRHLPACLYVLLPFLALCHAKEVSPIPLFSYIADILADLALILLPLRLIRGIKERRLRWRLILIFSTASSSYPKIFPFTIAHSFIFLSVMTTIVSLVHAALIITRGGIPVLISALVEDCMSLTVANLPVVATASIIRLSTTAARMEDPDGDGQRWSSWIFRSRTQPAGTANTTAQLTTDFRAKGGRVTGNTQTTTTDTTIDLTKKSAITTFEIGADEQLFRASGAEKTEGEKVDNQAAAAATPVRHEDRSVVRIDALPYPREPPPPTPATGEP